MSAKFPKMKSAKLLFFIVKCANCDVVAFVIASLRKLPVTFPSQGKRRVDPGIEHVVFSISFIA